MAVNARTEEFQHIEVFDKPALFTNGRIARDTVPKGWYCYDIRGSDDDPGELCYMEENVVVNHAGSVLMPEKLAMPKSGRLDVRDELGFLDEGDMTLREFCEAHQLPYPVKDSKYTLANANVDINGVFAIRGVKVIRGEKGPFVAMPQYKDSHGDYHDICFPCTKEARQQFNDTVLNAYEQSLRQAQQPDNAPAAEQVM